MKKIRKEYYFIAVLLILFILFNTCIKTTPIDTFAITYLKSEKALCFININEVKPSNATIPIVEASSVIIYFNWIK